MDIYRKKEKWKLGLMLIAVTIGLSSLLVTNYLVKSLSAEERKNMKLWAEATKELADLQSNLTDFSFILKVIQNNETVPVIVIDEEDNIIDHRNLNASRINNSHYLEKQLRAMKNRNEPIEIVFDDSRQYIYYHDSRLLILLNYYPYIQLLVMIVFLVIAYYAFSISRKAEQNQVWLGMSRETAHQLGTPTSSLMAWFELMKERDKDPVMLQELEKDIKRLEKITARFSRIGSKPVLKEENLIAVIENALDYLRPRSPKSVVFKTGYDREARLLIKLNISLFDWVIENVCKNSLDAMKGEGEIDIRIIDQEHTVLVDISDTGSGIPRNRIKTIFKPGYTTKRNGWGLGLSLSKRIIEEYHNGKIFVLNSDLIRGTTMRIILKK